MKNLSFLRLMSVVCAGCEQPKNPPASYFNCVDEERRFGSNHFILLNCNVTFNDIKDPDEWAGYIQSGLIKISPPGALVTNPPTATSFPIEGCGRQITGEATYTTDFTTYQFGGKTINACVSDSMLYWRDVLNNSAQYRIIYYDCDNLPLFNLDDGWMDQVLLGSPATVVGQNPGYEFSVSVIPNWAAGQENLGVWTTQFTIVKKGIMEGVFLPGVVEILE